MICIARQFPWIERRKDRKAAVGGLVSPSPLDNTVASAIHRANADRRVDDCGDAGEEGPGETTETTEEADKPEEEVDIDDDDDDWDFEDNEWDDDNYDEDFEEDDDGDW